jgi:hypothetical protein
MGREKPDAYKNVAYLLVRRHVGLIGSFARFRSTLVFSNKTARVAIAESGVVLDTRLATQQA